MAMKKGTQLEMTLEGFDRLNNHVLQGELSIVYRMLTDMCADALKSSEENPQIIALCEQLGLNYRQR